MLRGNLFREFSTSQVAARLGFAFFWTAFALFSLGSIAQVPSLLNYQGRVGVGGSAFDGTGQFKFALVNADASVTYWRSAVDADSNGEPDTAVSIPVSKGLFSVQLGDTTLPNMAALPPGVFANPAVYLRTWFNNGVAGFQRLSPDQRIAAVGYALMAASVPDGSISVAKLGTDVTTAISTAAPSGLLAASTSPADPSLLPLGYRPSGSLPAPAWFTLTSANAPSARFDHTAIWSGDTMFVWGGSLGGGLFSSTGAGYRPELDQWSPISPVNAPDARSGHVAVWSGTEMIVWGGFGTSGYLQTGGRYDPATLQWLALPLPGAPSGRVGAVAAWTGSRLVVWGGRNASGIQGDGALFNPVTGLWSALTLPNAPTARFGASAVWTGSRLLVWGGDGNTDAVNTGAELVCGVDGVPTEWRTISPASAPTPRSGHAAVWTGSKMLIWGGKRGANLAGDGASYDPSTSLWLPISSTGAPSARSSSSTVWTGSEMVVFAGETAGGATASGGAFDAAAGVWRTLSNGGGPVARSGSSTVWSGSQMIVFGGKSGATPIASGQALSPQPAFYLYRKP